MNLKMTLKVGLKFGSSTFFQYLCIVNQTKQYLSDKIKNKINNKEEKTNEKFDFIFR